MADATNVLGEVQSRSPGPSPSAMQAICSAEVALLTATACGRRNSASAASNRGTIGPCVSQSEQRTDTTASISSAADILPAVGNHAARLRLVAALGNLEEIRIWSELYSKPGGTLRPVSSTRSFVTHMPENVIVGWIT